MKLFNLKSILVLFAVFGLMITACEESSDPVVEGDDPVITSITESNPNIGDRVIIRGMYFGDTREEDYVTFNGVQPQPEDYYTWEDTLIDVRVPGGATSGNVIVSINEWKSNAYYLPIGAPESAMDLMATSIDDQSVKLKWTASASENADVEMEYLIDVSSSMGPIDPITVTSTDNPFIVDGLTEGTTYTFKVYAQYKDGNRSELDETASIQWSPATRFSLNMNEDEIRIYDNSSSFGSGLDFYYPDGEGPRAVTVNMAEFWNFALWAKDGEVFVGSPSEMDFNYSGGDLPETEYADVLPGFNSLDEVYDSQAVDAKTYSQRKFDLTQMSGNLVFFARVIEEDGQEYNYVKILVKEINGSYLQEGEGGDYIVCEISYQMAPGVPYCKP